MFEYYIMIKISSDFANIIKINIKIKSIKIFDTELKFSIFKKILNSWNRNLKMNMIKSLQLVILNNE